MPTYSYECKKCKHEFDIMQRMSDDALKDCPECGKRELKKVIKPSQSGGFALKGKGWFKSGGY